MNRNAPRLIDEMPLYQELRGILRLSEPAFSFPFSDHHRVRASVLVVLSGETFMNSKILLMKRAPDVLSHPGQVSFPGGGEELADEGDPVRTALRECEEELGLGSGLVSPLGVLPELPTLTGGFRVTPVLAFAHAEISERPLLPDPTEVAHAGWVSVASLIESRVEHRTYPEFLWSGERVWGLTALIFDLVLKRYDRIKAC